MRGTNLTIEQSKSDGEIVDQVWLLIDALNAEINKLVPKIHDQAVGIVIQRASTDFLRRGSQMMKEVDAVLERHMLDMTGGRLN